MLRLLRIATPLLAVLAVFTLAGAAQAHGRDPHAAVAARNGWRTNLTEAKQEAATTNKPLMVVLRCFD
jgi:peptidoglycan/LPS O-acetylase OafA/YrhL